MPRIGPRLWKTGLAVALTITVVRLAGLHNEVYGAVAAALAVAPSASHSLRSAVSQLGAHLLGGLLGTVTVLLFGQNPIAVGLAVVAVLVLCQQFNWKSLGTAAVTVALFVMNQPPSAVENYTLMRMISVAIGVLVGTGVNALILPPNYGPDLLRAIDRAGDRLDAFFLQVTERLDRPASLSKAEILAGAAAVEAEIAEARRLASLVEATRTPANHAVAERSIKVLASLLERLLVIHKQALTAERDPAYAEYLPEIQEALRTLVQLRSELYRRLAGKAPLPALPVRLAEIERTFEGPHGVPASHNEVEGFFRIYRMRTGVAYIANRLNRLSVAMDGAQPQVPAPAGAPEGAVIEPS